VSFSIDTEDEEAEDGEAVRKYGRSKEGTWDPQVVVALAVTREGLPVRSWVFPGNTTDVETIQRVKADLKGWKLGRALFVGDAGLNSEENREDLAKACGTYLLATRMGSVKEIKEEVLSRPGRYKKVSENLYVKEVVVGGQGVSRRRYLLCYNPREAERQGKHRQKLVQMLEAELAKHPDKSATAQWAIELLASRRTKRYVTITSKGQISINRKAIREAARTDGKWVLQTNDDSLSTTDAACAYKALAIIERCFRTLKRTQLKLNPVYHWLPHRIVAHVKICVLSLLIERVAELECQQSWAHLRRVLGGLQVTEFHTFSHAFFQRNEPSSALVELLKKLSIPLPTSVLSLIPLEKPSQNA
jgi:transposase